jgi:plastocyanin
VASSLPSCNAISGIGDYDVVEAGKCRAAADCPAPSSPCAQASCEAGVCGTVFLPDGTALPDALQTVGDCAVLVCDGSGAAISRSSDGDLDDDGNECTKDVCTDGQISHPPEAAASDCMDGTKVCDGKGECVDKDCLNGIQDGTETDLDCGGPDCGGCSPGGTCLVFSDCDSSVCSAGVCQEPVCTDQVTNGEETDKDCGGGECDKCEEGQACLNGSDCVTLLCMNRSCASSCGNRILDGTETDLDCGGLCEPCDVGMACADAADCVTGQCIDSVCAMLNLCDPAVAFDATAETDLTVTFTGAGKLYSPKCFIVKAGTNVTFQGDFLAHPLTGGVVDTSGPNHVALPDMTSPFMPPTTTGNTKTFVLDDPGAYGFYCSEHYDTSPGMFGAAFVVP